MKKTDLIIKLKEYRDFQKESDYDFLESDEEVENILKDYSEDEIDKALIYFYKFIKETIKTFFPKTFTTVSNATVLKNIILIRIS